MDEVLQQLGWINLELLGSSPTNGRGINSNHQLWLIFQHRLGTFGAGLGWLRVGLGLAWGGCTVGLGLADVGLGCNNEQKGHPTAFFR